MKKEFLNPSELPDWSETFTQVVMVEGATRTIYIAGQVGVDQARQLVGDGSLHTQTEQAFSNLITALAAAGATVTDVVKLNLYVKNYRPADAVVIGEVFRSHFTHQQLPVSTWLGVQSLAREEFLIEIDAIGVIA